MSTYPFLQVNPPPWSGTKPISVPFPWCPIKVWPKHPHQMVVKNPQEKVPPSYLCWQFVALCSYIYRYTCKSSTQSTISTQQTVNYS